MKELPQIEVLDSRGIPSFWRVCEQRGPFVLLEDHGHGFRFAKQRLGAWYHMPMLDVLIELKHSHDCKAAAIREMAEIEAIEAIFEEVAPTDGAVK